MIEKALLVERLRSFVEESNRIEGITRDVRLRELVAAEEFMDLKEVHIKDLENFVKACEPKAVLRDKAGLNVMVGGHIPVPGGPHVLSALGDILYKAHSREYGPYEIHLDYETLHPFTDCNGRSGRILWAWQMVNQADRFGLNLGFLHAWYYQSLSHSRR